MRALVLLVAVLASAAGCLRTTSYKCSDTTQCGGGGVCEDTGYCSFSDSSCMEGRRYGEYSGPYANVCVGELIPGLDAGVDMMTTVDMSTTNNCPGTYTMIGSITNRRYRVIANQAQFATQKAACAADGANAYLAVPDDQAELNALVTAVNMSQFWVGIEDPADDDVYVTVRTTAFSDQSPLWAMNEPDNNPEGGGGGDANCVRADQTGSRLSTDRCTNNFAAICECEP